MRAYLLKIVYWKDTHFDQCGRLVSRETVLKQHTELFLKIECTVELSGK